MLHSLSVSEALTTRSPLPLELLLPPVMLRPERCTTAPVMWKTGTPRSWASITTVPETAASTVTFLVMASAGPARA
eukprot:7381862-Prymnesium_polylepis.1